MYSRHQDCRRQKTRTLNTFRAIVQFTPLRQTRHRQDRLVLSGGRRELDIRLRPRCQFHTSLHGALEWTGVANAPLCEKMTSATKPEVQNELLRGPPSPSLWTTDRRHHGRLHRRDSKCYILIVLLYVKHALHFIDPERMKG